MLAPFFTLSQDDGPITTGAFALLQGSIDHAGLHKQVILAEVTVDPTSDTPAMLRRYADHVGASWEMLTGSPVSLQRLWIAFGVYNVEVPESTPEDFNWLTGQPLDYDFDLSNMVIVIDGHGRERFFASALPGTDGTLPPVLANMLDEEGIQDLTSPRGTTWSPSLVMHAAMWLTKTPDAASGLRRKQLHS